MGSVADAIILPARLTHSFADLIAAGISAETFACKPDGVDCNSPAFVFGHLAIYPPRIVEMLGATPSFNPDPNYLELFEAGKECLHDPTGATYPPKEELLAAFKTGNEEAIAVAAEASDGAFAQENPNERMRERFPTVGAMVNFLFLGHTMMHFGQVSTWRRAMGLGPAM